jgi:hypothetical protein
LVYVTNHGSACVSPIHITKRSWGSAFIIIGNLRAGRSGAQFLAGERCIFLDRLWGPFSVLFCRYRRLTMRLKRPESGRKANITDGLYLMRKLRMSGVTPLFLFIVVLAWAGQTLHVLLYAYARNTNKLYLFNYFKSNRQNLCGAGTARSV